MFYAVKIGILCWQVAALSALFILCVYLPTSSITSISLELILYVINMFKVQ